MNTAEKMITKFCALQSAVAHTRKDYENANDCFCPESSFKEDPDLYRNDETAYDYIRQAVIEKLKADGFDVSETFGEKGKDF